jgi:glucose-1-phosphate thymidylyltransferase
VKGIILAGGKGSRLYPLTLTISKQLLPVYDKPLFHYPLATLIQIGIREILFVVASGQKKIFENSLKFLQEFNLKVEVVEQEKPSGIAEALILGRSFIGADKVCLILGDNIFHGVGFGRDLSRYQDVNGAHIVVREVQNPKDFGVLILDSEGRAIDVEEKPLEFKSSLAITGLYFFDNRAVDFAQLLTPSQRGELEITDVLKYYCKDGSLNYSMMPRGSSWFDAGSVESLLEASNFIRSIESSTGQKVNCVEEICLISGLVESSKLSTIAATYPNNYGDYLKNLAGNLNRG